MVQRERERNVTASMKAGENGRLVVTGETRLTQVSVERGATWVTRWRRDLLVGASALGEEDDPPRPLPGSTTHG